MSFAANEESQYGGTPDELYVFAIGVMEQYYTSSTNDIVKGDNTYSAVAISRSEISLDNELNKAGMTIEVDFDHPIPSLFNVAPPDTVVKVTVLRRHGGEDSYASIWKGRIINCSWKTQHIELESEAISTSMKQPGLRRIYSRGCPFEVYGSDCRAQSSDFKTTATVAAVTNITVDCLEVSLFDDGYFNGGFIEWPGAYGNINTRTIVSHSGRILTLLSSTDGLDVLQSISVYPGCDLTRSQCDTKFNNILNYGGMPNKPTTDPYGFSDQVF